MAQGKKCLQSTHKPLSLHPQHLCKGQTQQYTPLIQHHQGEQKADALDLIQPSCEKQELQVQRETLCQQMSS